MSSKPIAFDVHNPSDSPQSFSQSVSGIVVGGDFVEFTASETLLCEHGHIRTHGDCAACSEALAEYERTLLEEG